VESSVSSGGGDTSNTLIGGFGHEKGYIPRSTIIDIISEFTDSSVSKFFKTNISSKSVSKRRRSNRVLGLYGFRYIIFPIFQRSEVVSEGTGPVVTVVKGVDLVVSGVESGELDG